MATLDVYMRFETAINGVPVTGGSRSTPREITVGDDYIDRRNTLTAATTWDAWLGGSEEAVTSFVFGWVESDVDGVLVEQTCDANNGVGRVQFVNEVRAGIPFVIPIDDSIAAHTADFGAGTADVIDTIRIRNPTGAATDAKVRLVLFSA
jgi:hypothetical protein